MAKDIPVNLALSIFPPTLDFSVSILLSPDVEKENLLSIKWSKKGFQKLQMYCEFQGIKLYAKSLLRF